MARTPSSAKISLDDFTETTLSAVARSLVANSGSKHPLFTHPHVTVGIIWRPDIRGPEMSDLKGQIPGKIGGAGG